MSHITNQDRFNLLADSVIHREKEVFSYQINIDNYTAMIASMEELTLPADLAQYEGKKSHELPMALTEDQVQTITDYNYLQQLKAALRTEKVEQGKTQRILDAVKSQIPADQYETLIADAIARMKASV